MLVTKDFLVVVKKRNLYAQPPLLLYDLPPAQLASVFVCTASALFQSFELFRGRRPSPSSVSPAFFATNLIEGQGT